MYHSYHTNVNVLFLIFVQFQSIKVPLRCCFVVCSVQEEIQKKLTLTSHHELCSLSHFNHRMTQINHYSKHHLTLHLKEKFTPRPVSLPDYANRVMFWPEISKKRFVGIKLSTVLPQINARS